MYQPNNKLELYLVYFSGRKFFFPFNGSCNVLCVTSHRYMVYSEDKILIPNCVYKKKNK